MNDVRKATRSVSNRIQSIVEDAEFVSCVHQCYNKPLIPNRRCGLWYVPPDIRGGECYFKSTDGHTGQWSFSLKRINLHLLQLIEEAHGLIIVDSTRRGKLMPDALSKTIPIWCAVLNFALLDYKEMRFPADCVAASEIDIVKSLVPEWAENFRSQVPKHLWPTLSKPLRPLWITPNASLPMNDFQQDEPVFSDAHAVILCTASRRAQDGQFYDSGVSYVQGAADDHELWAPVGFTPELLWSNPGLRELGQGDAELLRRIHSVMESQNNSKKTHQLTQVHSHLTVAHASAGDVFIEGPLIDLRSTSSPLSQRSLQIQIPPGKKGSKNLGRSLPSISDYFESLNCPILTIMSDPGTDIAECVTLMLDCRFFEASGVPRAQKASYVSKEEVTRRNLSIMAKSGVHPSRASQNVVGAFLRNS